MTPTLLYRPGVACNIWKSVAEGLQGRERRHGSTSGAASVCLPLYSNGNRSGRVLIRLGIHIICLCQRLAIGSDFVGSTRRLWRDWLGHVVPRASTDSRRVSRRQMGQLRSQIATVVARIVVAPLLIPRPDLLVLHLQSLVSNLFFGVLEADKYSHISHQR